MSDRPSLGRRLTAEGVGTALLLAAVVGSGIMGEPPAAGNVAGAFLANTIATGAAPEALIPTFGPISGGHLDPAVTLADAAQGGLAWPDVTLYIAAQVLGAFGGVAAAHVMFELRGARARGSVPAIPFAMAAYITAAYRFTASTSFANPAITLPRSVPGTFSGIRPADAPGFIAAQLAGAGVATALFRWLAPPEP